MHVKSSGFALQHARVKHRASSMYLRITYRYFCVYLADTLGLPTSYF